MLDRRALNANPEVLAPPRRGRYQSRRWPLRASPSRALTSLRATRRRALRIRMPGRLSARPCARAPSHPRSLPPARPPTGAPSHRRALPPARPCARAVVTNRRGVRESRRFVTTAGWDAARRAVRRAFAVEVGVLKPLDAAPYARMRPRCRHKASRCLRGSTFCDHGGVGSSTLGGAACVCRGSLRVRAARCCALRTRAPRASRAPHAPTRPR